MIYALLSAAVSTTVSTFVAPKPDVVVEDQVTRHALVDSAAQYSASDGLYVTKAFAGGQYIAYISKANDTTKGFMDVKVDDLLASYAFDKNGNLQDKAIWIRPSDSVNPLEKMQVAGMLRIMLSDRSHDSWFQSGIQLWVSKQSSMYALTVAPLTTSTSYRLALQRCGQGKR